MPSSIPLSSLSQCRILSTHTYTDWTYWESHITESQPPTISPFNLGTHQQLVGWGGCKSLYIWGLRCSYPFVCCSLFRDRSRTFDAKREMRVEVCTSRAMFKTNKKERNHRQAKHSGFQDSIFCPSHWMLSSIRLVNTLRSTNGNQKVPLLKNFVPVCVCRISSFHSLKQISVVVALLHLYISDAQWILEAVLISAGGDIHCVRCQVIAFNHLTRPSHLNCSGCRAIRRCCSSHMNRS